MPSGKSLDGLGPRERVFVDLVRLNAARRGCHLSWAALSRRADLGGKVLWQMQSRGWLTAEIAARVLEVLRECGADLDGVVIGTAQDLLQERLEAAR